MIRNTLCEILKFGKSASGRVRSDFRQTHSESQRDKGVCVRFDQNNCTYTAWLSFKAIARQLMTGLPVRMSTNS